MNVFVIRLLGVTLSVLLLSSAYREPAAHTVMAEAAGHFLNALTPEQQAKTTFPFQDEERLNWHFIPRERKGLPLREMSPAQRHLAHALMAASLSQKGLIKTDSIMSLEEVLRILENDSGERRNPEKYYFSIFGKPGEKTWGFRLEGHHISLNYTLHNGAVVASPNFFGANPAEVRTGPRKGLRVLAREEDIARELLLALNPEQQKTAIVSPKAYPDILTEASRKAALSGQPTGLSAEKMTAAQRDLLQTLLWEYAGNFPADVAKARMDKVKAAGKNLQFAWAGVKERGGPHYYRIQSPTFLIEYDNTQNNNNHIHCVWRDFEGDWGFDVLGKHYQTSHKR
jgi:hypothetical protein